MYLYITTFDLPKRKC